jgi:hypothetical protein
MILKKPYAFLIKNFKKIHLILAITMAYVGYKTYTIYGFFKDSAANNYYASLGYEQRNYYVNFFVLLVIILIIASLGAILYLLNYKKKPRKFYIYSIGFYVLLFVYFIILKGVFSGLLRTTIEMQAIRAYQDISFIAIVPQAALVIYSLITAVGITLKKFNFAADLKELEITSSDNEEVELNINFEGYKTKRNFRKNIREFKYYVSENRFVITCILGVIGAILGFTVVKAIIKKGSSIISNQSAINNKFTIRAEDSIISNLKPDGKEINGKYYLVVKLYIKNNTNTNVALDYSNYHLVYKKKNITPTLQPSEYFFDFAMPYLGDELKPQEERSIALAFEIAKSDIKSNFMLKVYKGSSINGKKLKADYNDIKLKPRMQMDIGDAARVKMGDEISFVNSNVGATKLKVTSYSFDSSYQYTYEMCNDDICKPKTDIITPDYMASNKSSYLMILDYEFDLDKNSIYSKYEGDFSNFTTHFLKVRYVKNGQTYYSPAISRNDDNLKGVVDEKTGYIKGKEVVQVYKDVADADEIQLVFTIRNRNHIISLK